MSRSRRKNIVWNMGQSQWKRQANQRLRRANKVRVHEGKDTLLPDEVGNLWDSPIDGRWPYAPPSTAKERAK